MGRWSWSNRRTTEECRSLSVVQMARAGVFRKGPGTFWTSRWTNAASEEVASIGYLLTSTPEGSLALRLTYTITNLDTGEKTPLKLHHRDHHHVVPLRRSAILAPLPACPERRPLREAGRQALPASGRTILRLPDVPLSHVPELPEARQASGRPAETPGRGASQGHGIRRLPNLTAGS